ncbi:C3a anaphylatoxin chemotactic receptor [Denticeps clupeoides]|nr:C3a anaphylatoxin chemotactic receptor-like [Denticeps clupeoides]XP_028810994.1 C3a anaphylatoxin chemotactic receptor-like [Denticeps clupeoides]
MSNFNTSLSRPSIATGDPWQSEASRVIQIVLTLVIFLVGAFLNMLVVWVLGIRRWNLRRSSETQGASSFRTYVVNLALADLVLLLRTPLMLGYLAHNFSWPFGHSACQLVMFLRALGLYAAACLLCAVALERCLCLLRPVWARLKRPRWVVTLVCGLLWLLALALASPYLAAATLKDFNGTTQCLESDPSSQQAKGHGLFIAETVFGFLLPLLVFLSCNLAVLISARRTNSAPSSSVASPTLSSPTSSNYTSQRLLRLYRVLLLTVLLFLTCWVPYFTCRFLRWLTASRPPSDPLRVSAVRGYYVSLFLVYVKSALNPVLYVFAARGLGRTLRASLLSTIERVFNDDASESARRKSLRRRDSQF